VRKKTRKNILNLAALVLMVLFAAGLLYLVIFNDPIVETEYDTGNERTTLIIREHTKTGVKDYIYGVRDGVGNINP